jgi:radical SAM superfamily enzyme YgiQ (UPF0313 family)
MPLGVGYLAAALSDSFELGIVDGTVLWQQDYDDALASADSKAFLISCTLLQLREGLRIVDLVKQKSPDALTVMGGPAFGSVPTESLVRGHNVDVVVIGEAEEMIGCVVGTPDKETMAGMLAERYTVRNANGTLEVSTLSSKPDVDLLPHPLWDLFDTQRYMELWSEAVGMTSMQVMGSRGCPFSCAFCDKTVTGNKYRPRKVSDVVIEIATIQGAFGYSEIFYNDDLFTTNEDRVVQMCGEIRKEVPALQWSAQARVDTVTPVMLEAMVQSGCEEIYFGVESGSDRILEILRKGITRDQIEKAFDLCHRVGIKPGAYLIVGVPGERVEDIDATISLLDRIKPTLLNYSYLTPFPGTEIYRNTAHLIAEPDYTLWDDFRRTVYQDACFEVPPDVSLQRIKSHYKEMLAAGLESSSWCHSD